MWRVNWGGEQDFLSISPNLRVVLAEKDPKFKVIQGDWVWEAFELISPAAAYRWKGRIHLNVNESQMKKPEKIQIAR